MRAIGLEPSSLAVSKLYRGLIGCMLVDPADADHGEAMRTEGVKAVASPIVMKTRADEIQLARDVMGA